MDWEKLAAMAKDLGMDKEETTRFFEVAQKEHDKQLALQERAREAEYERAREEHEREKERAREEHEREKERAREEHEREKERAREEHERERERAREQHEREKEILELKLKLAEVNACPRGDPSNASTPTCSKNLAVFLKERKLSTVEEMAKQADQFVEAQGLRNLEKGDRDDHKEEESNSEAPREFSSEDRDEL
ncbi:RNA-binding protein 25-like [Rhipicephalus sanguineus]|uniref:RNA-binding protein 25-like n=1 Tax=Rhipicephalus sanguineus TaxID=34632 RepID=UPI00189568ED|nr:RNA-binding protein 25-like [Rhipicephalus sanguineus]